MKTRKFTVSLAEANPEIAKQWDYERNFPVTPDEIGFSSNQKFWWKCDRNHSWQARPNDRISNAKGKALCPYCGNKKVLAGFNDVKTLYPHIAEEWDVSNNELPIDNYLPGSHAKASWICSFGHTWQATIKDRCYKGSNCPYCAGKRIWAGFNDLFTLYPGLLQYWDEEKNIGVDTSRIRIMCKSRYWWKCLYENHSFQERPFSMIKSQCCPICSGKRLLTGFNDLKTRYPLLAEEWDWEKNTTSPSEYLAYSGSEVWWKCKDGHSWKAAIYSRSYGSNNCPICSNHKVLKGYNDLETAQPKLIEEWNWERNILMPSEVSPYSDRKVWWKCKRGHEWEAAIGNRSAGTKCPYCSFYGSSFVEMATFYYIEQFFADAQYRIKIDGWEADIYIPSINTAIEYDGGFFHSSSTAYNRDTLKTDAFLKKGISLIRIRAGNIPTIEGCKNIYHKSGRMSDFSEMMKELLNALGINEDNINIDTDRDYEEIQSVYAEHYRKEKFSA